MKSFFSVCCWEFRLLRHLAIHIRGHPVLTSGDKVYQTVYDLFVTPTGRRRIWIFRTIVHHESSILPSFVCLLTSKLKFPISYDASCIRLVCRVLHVLSSSHSCLIIVVVRTLLLAISTAIWIQIARRPNVKKTIHIRGVESESINKSSIGWIHDMPWMNICKWMKPPDSLP